MTVPSDRFTRRSFLKQTAATAAALSAPMIFPRAASGLPPPGERLTLGFIGVGNMGSGHVEGFLARKEVQVVAVCDVDADKRRSARQKVETHYAARRASGDYRGCEEYHEFERLLERPDIDAVLIAVPDHWHALIACAAARAGKDIYCEKPLSLTVREARAMVTAVRRHDRVFQTGSQQRSSPEFRKACELVRNGRLGQLQTVIVNIGSPSRDAYFPEEPVPPGFDWERWLGPAPWSPYHGERRSGNYSGGWRLIRDYSGGMTTDWGAHHFDIVQWALGMDASGPVKIVPPPRRDGHGLTYTYANGVTLVRDEKFEDRDVGHNVILFVGTDGRVEVQRGRLKTWPEDLGKEPIGAGEIHLPESPGHQTDWLDCVRTRRRPICDVEIGCRSVTVCHLGNVACWLERPLQWDPAREEIVGDPLASRWLDRPKRAPWRL